MKITVSKLSFLAALFVAAGGPHVPAVVAHTTYTPIAAIRPIPLMAPGGVVLDAGSEFAALSANGRHVVFASGATNLTPASSSARKKIFVWDRQTGLFTYEGDSDCFGFAAAISDDGRFVAYPEDDFPPSFFGPAGIARVVVRDRERGTVTPGTGTYRHCHGWSMSGDARFVTHFADLGVLVTRDITSGVDTTTVTGGNTVHSAMSRDGRLLAFAVPAPRFGGPDQIYVLDRLSGTSTRELPDGTLVGAPPAMSADGRYVAYPAVSSAGIVLRDRLTGISTTIASDGFYVKLSRDGRFVTFLRGYPYSHCVVYDAVTRATVDYGDASHCSSVEGGLIAITRFSGRFDPRREVYVAEVDPSKVVAPWLSAADFPDHVPFVWSAPAGMSPASYVVEVGSASGASDLLRRSVPASETATRIESRSSGVFFGRVIALDGDGRGVVSNEVIVARRSGTQCLTGAAPPLITSTDVSGNHVALSWWVPSSADVLSYVIEAGTSLRARDVGSFETAARTLTIQTLRIPDVPPGVYYVRIRARNACGFGVPTDDVRLVVG